MSNLLQKTVGVGDLVLLEDISEEAILENLRKRLIAGDIYVSCCPCRLA
jgi:myosin heavy subunit